MEEFPSLGAAFGFYALMLFNRGYPVIDRGFGRNTDVFVEFQV